MSTKINKEELLKSLTDGGLFTEDEALAIIQDSELEKSEESKIEKAELEKAELAKAAKDDKDDKDEYSDEKEKELEKACNDSKAAYDNYKNKKPVEKSEKSEIEKLEENTIEKSLVDGLEKMQSVFSKQIDEINKSHDDKIDLMQETIDKIGNQVPPFKGADLTANIIEKAVDGIKDGDNVYLSKSVHKEQIGELLADTLDDKDLTEAVRDRIDIDLSNFVAGQGAISKATIDFFEKEKNIIIK